MPTRLLIADDHRLFRQGLRALVDRIPGIEVVGEAEDGREAVRLALERDADVVVMDLSMPELNGFDATREVRLAAPRCRVVALSMHSDPRFVARALEAGAAGYVLKEAAFEEVAAAITAVSKGLRYLSTQLRPLDEAPQRRVGIGGSGSRRALTPRERQVVQLLAEGRGTRGAADSLGVSPKTVETHRANAMRKLGIDSLAELTKFAVREGLTPLD